MADWLSVTLLIGCGIVLIIIEIVFVPGTTILGILGILMLFGGVYFSYVNFGSSVGTGVLIGTLLVSLTALVYSLRAGVWSKFSLKSQIDSKVNEHEKDDLAVGLQGTAISDLRPVGTAEFSDQLFEVQTNGNYLEAGTNIAIVKISDNKIIVEPL